MSYTCGYYNYEVDYDHWIKEKWLIKTETHIMNRESTQQIHTQTDLEKIL